MEKVYHEIFSWNYLMAISSVHIIITKQKNFRNYYMQDIYLVGTAILKYHIWDRR